jgi:hypothetical protein
MHEKLGTTHLTPDLEFARTPHTQGGREETTRGARRGTRGGFYETLKSLGRKASPATTRGTQNTKKVERITKPRSLRFPLFPNPITSSLLNVLSWVPVENVAHM